MMGGKIGNNSNAVTVSSLGDLGHVVGIDGGGGAAGLVDDEVGIVVISDGDGDNLHGLNGGVGEGSTQSTETLLGTATEHHPLTQMMVVSSCIATYLIFNLLAAMSYKIPWLSVPLMLICTPCLPKNLVMTGIKPLFLRRP